MPINSIQNAAAYSDELDRLFTQKSATGFFADNALRTKFVGAKTVIIPNVDFAGLADYDRDSGFSRGAVTVTGSSYTMAMDRARSLQIDREDMDESGVAGLAGKILGEYVRTKVVPECDAYVISKLARLAEARANVVEGDTSKPYAALCELINSVREKVGYDEELVAFLDAKLYALLQNSDEISRMITVSDFKQGEVNLSVKSLNGVALIPVVSERMKTEYDFLSSSAGGFAPKTGAKSVYMMVCPKSGAHLVKKTEQLRVFTPEQNIDADAYKFDYRIYYDVFVENSGLDAVWAWISPEVNITSQPSDRSVTAGSISGSLSVTATSTGTLGYQWYSCAADGGRAVKVSGAKSASMTIPTSLTAGEYHYFVKISVDGVEAATSNVATVTVN